MFYMSLKEHNTISGGRSEPRLMCRYSCLYNRVITQWSPDPESNVLSNEVCQILAEI